MGESKMAEMSLPSLFEQARKIHQMASDSTADQVFADLKFEFGISEDLFDYFFVKKKLFVIGNVVMQMQESVKKGCKVLEQCEDMISKLGLFSSNETKDDISTANLKYLLVPYYLAELTEKVSQEDRIQIVKASQAKLKEFLSFCEAMELVPQEELESVAQGGSNSFGDKRARKIARFKRQRAAESKLLEIKEHRERHVRSTRAAALSTPVEAGEEDVLDDDGGEEREA